MRTTNTFSILFWVDQKKAIFNYALIYARVSVNGKRVNISTKRKVHLEIWDTKKKKATGNSSEASQVNLYLDQVHSQIFQCYQDLIFKKKLVTAKLIKSNYVGEGENAKTLQNIIDYHAKKSESTLASGTIRNFLVTEKYIKRYLKRVFKTTDIYLNQLDYKFICDFEHFLHTYWPKGHPNGMSHNTVMKHIQRFRKMVTLAFHLEWIDKDPFIRWKPTFEKREREFLSANELSNIETYNFPIERLDRVRDLFIFSCYTGISYADIIVLTESNIVMGIDGFNWIITKRQKTKTPVKVPILDKAQELIAKYSNHPMTIVSETLFPVISNAKLNLYLKEIADACGIKKNLTFHIARHTFATTITLTNGVPIETVSKLLGHTRVATTQIYAKVIERKVSTDMLSLKKKLKFESEN
ncbi:site-specific integrase [Tamlana sp. 2_MG-2023]|uniref:site-specific integrase n=1 Tax=unclassified Tamlana TaxID=2614803 RepID=UPI0026E316DF|nr:MULTISPECIES: site-specific integrase [unclassified Tamlana]MDO6761591.1 site-specific integrase [Tamlana sp. 2_MG-2023]MDO6792437.1 site-specific integrase [Tamlana sp. 1_MG-2023]